MSTVATLTDVAKRLDPDGQIAQIVEMLNQFNPILDDMAWNEGNLPTGHRTTVRTGLPAVTWRLLNNGVVPSKSTTAQIDEQAGMLEAFCEIDKDLAMLNGNTAAFRMSEARAFIEAMTQEMAQTLIYGAASAPEEFIGLAARYPALSGSESAQNVITASGSPSGADQSSMWLVAWSPDAVFGIYPKGSQAGLVHEDLGEQMVQTGTGIGTGRMMALVDRWQWKCGLALRDWRYVVRICNIDTSVLVADFAGTTTRLIECMSRALDRIPTFAGTRPAFYCNRTVFSWLRIHAMNRTSNVLAIDQGLDQFGNVKRGELTFQGIPVKRVDQLLNTEAVIS
jgi:hypothetical protein